jgi:hypothetical protein
MNMKYTHKNNKPRQIGKMYIIYEEENWSMQMNFMGGFQVGD